MDAPAIFERAFDLYLARIAVAMGFSMVVGIGRRKAVMSTGSQAPSSTPKAQQRPRSRVARAEPSLLDFAQFKLRFESDPDVIWRNILLENKEIIKVKKEKFALPNLKLIIGTTIELSNAAGFHAMSLRDLSEAAKISMGSLYSYIESKDTLLKMILTEVAHLIEATLGAVEIGTLEPRERLRSLLRTHIFLTELMQPWFFFAYMEAKSFSREGRRMAIRSELRTEDLIASCIRAGQTSGTFRPVDPTMTASLIKPVLQDWYLKNWKYRRRNIGPDDYADWAIDFVESFLIART